MTVKELYENMGGSYASAQRILQMDALIEKFIVKFLDDQSYAKLMEAAAGHDEKALFEASHALKGVCANLGLDSLSAAASAVSEEFRPGNPRRMDEEQLAAKLAEITDIYDRTVENVKAFSQK